MKYLFLATIFFVTSTFAGTQKGIVNYINAHQNQYGAGHVDVEIDAGWNNKAACNTKDGWVLKVDTESGKAQLAALLTAYSTGKEIRLTGHGTGSAGTDCASSREIIRNITFESN